MSFTCPKGHHWESLADGSPLANRETLACPKCGAAPVGAPTIGYANPSPFELPEQFGRYRILKKVGEGGMGSVYLAHDTQLDRRVALKTPQFTGADQALARERFYREARTVATLNHPSICPVHDVGEIDGIPYLTMAFIEGKLLADFVNSDPPPTARQIALLIRRVALALQEAHLRGIVHRDLKPSNIMINGRGEPVVLDFGLARRRERADARLTQDGTVMGTPAYMPPEQVRGDLEATAAASDIYSLGVILYELLCGQVPFAGDPMATLCQILEDEPVPPSARRAGVDRALEAICQRAMQKEVAQRYASMAEMAKVLQDYLRGEPMPMPISLPELPELMGPADGAAAPLTTASRFGFPVSQMGGLRSMALAYREPPARQADLALAPELRSRKSAKRGGVPLWLGLVGAAGAAALFLAVIVISVQSDYGTVRIELNDPRAEVQIKVDGTIEITNLEEPLRLKAGEHGLVVTGKNYETISKAFTLTRGENSVLHVELEERPKPVVAIATPQPATASPKPDLTKTTSQSTPTRPPVTAATPPRPASGQPPPGVGRPSSANRPVPRDWISIMPSAEEVSRTDYAKYQNGVLSITAKDDVNFGSRRMGHEAQDAELRIVVKKVSGQAVFMLGRAVTGKGFYQTHFDNGGGIGIGKMVQRNGKWEFIHLGYKRLPGKFKEFFEYTFRVQGNVLTVEADGQQVLQVRDSEITGKGEMAFSAQNGRGLFKKAEIKILH